MLRTYVFDGLLADRQVPGRPAGHGWLHAVIGRITPA
jgi:hypothetical protein